MATDQLDVVLSGVHSATHLVYASSYLRHRLAVDQRPIRVVVLATGPALGSGPAREALVASLLPRDERLDVRFAEPADPWWSGLGRDLVLLSVGAPSIRALAQLLGRGRRRPHVVVVDEGIGSYGTWRTRRAAYRRQGGSRLWSGLRAVAVAGTARVVPDVRWALYEQTRSGWHVRPEVAREFTRRLQGDAPASRGAIYLTQPWPDVGVMSEGSYAAHLAAVRDACGGAGLAFQLRPHPWEPRARYVGFELMPDHGPAELDRGLVGAAVVIGANSTALLNLSAVHHTNVLRVSVPELAALDAALSPRQRSLLDAYLPPPLRAAEVGSHLPLD